MFFRGLHNWLVGVTMAALTFLAAGSAAATPLNLILEPEPDIFYQFATVNYNSTTDILTLTSFVGSAANVDAFAVIDQPISLGQVSLTATVNSLGVLSAGTLTVTGTVAPFGWNSGTILTANLTAIGFPAGAGALEFLFTATGGDAQSEYGGAGALTIGIVNGFAGSWASDFSGSFATGDIGTVVPEPSTALLLSFGVGFMSWTRRNTNAKSRARR